MCDFLLCTARCLCTVLITAVHLVFSSIHVAYYHLNLLTCHRLLFIKICKFDTFANGVTSLVIIVFSCSSLFISLYYLFLWEFTYQCVTNTTIGITILWLLLPAVIYLSSPSLSSFDFNWRLLNTWLAYQSDRLFTGSFSPTAIQVT